jgi:hypothetical protein
LRGDYTRVLAEVRSENPCCFSDLTRVVVLGRWTSIGNAAWVTGIEIANALSLRVVLELVSLHRHWNTMATYVLDHPAFEYR